MYIIANPLYDSVFKYLMEDSEIARGILSRLLGLEILSLEARPQETSVRMADAPQSGEAVVRIYRLDFVAEVVFHNGEKRKVLVELQKADASGHVDRFRRYLGRHYALRPPEGENSLPIIAVYLLGYTMSPDLPKVVRVVRNYLNGVSGEAILQERNEPFIEQLTHDAVVVQIPLLDDHMESEVERMLTVFDQRRVDATRHFLQVDEGLMDSADPLLRRMVRELLKCAQNEETQLQMDAEDEMEKVMFDLDTTKVRLKQTQEFAAAESERAKRESARAEEESRRAEQESKRAEEASKRAEEERRLKEQALAELESLRRKVQETSGQGN